MTVLLCLLFFFGYIPLRQHWQALAFLGIGAGVQLLSYAVPAPQSAPVTQPDSTALILVCAFSVLGYIAWRSSRKWLMSAPYGKQRLLIFLGWGANGVLFVFILWLTGMLHITA